MNLHGGTVVSTTTLASMQFGASFFAYASSNMLIAEGLLVLSFISLFVAFASLIRFSINLRRRTNNSVFYRPEHLPSDL
jgi:hypothetical protein